jgi:hypothetical protein
VSFSALVYLISDAKPQQFLSLLVYQREPSSHFSAFRYDPVSSRTFHDSKHNTAKLAQTLYSLVTGEAVAKLSSNHTATVAVYPILIFNLLVITIYAQLEGTAD